MTKKSFRNTLISFFLIVILLMAVVVMGVRQIAMKSI